MGSAALAHLAARKLRVLGVERHTIGHHLGSSHGASRVIRKAYAEEPRYVPLVLRAYELWRQLERRSHSNLLTITGAIHIGNPENRSIASIKTAVQVHRLAHETLDAAEISKRFPAFVPHPDSIGIVEADGGALAVERAVAAHVEAAVADGAEVRVGQQVASVETDGSGVLVVTADGTSHRAAAAVVCTGPWLSEIVSAGDARALELSVSRQVQLWFAPTKPELFKLGSFPVFIDHALGGEYYGLPPVGHAGVKVCQHYGGLPTSPESVDRRCHGEDEASVRRYLSRHLPAANGRLLDSAVCLYTNSPDKHFVVGRHPRLDNVFVAGGFSGHGFKFAPVIGEILADLVIDSSTEHEIGLFDPTRGIPTGTIVS